MAQFQIREFASSDLAALSAILRSSPEAAIWSDAALAGLGSAPGIRTFVATDQSQVTGFVIVRVAADEAELLNLAVAPEHRHAGQGTALLQHAFDALHTRGARTIFLEVRASNRPAIAFYQRHGFAISGRRRNYYRDPPEDALTMSCALPGVR